MCKQMQLCVFASPSLCVKINEGRNENMKNDCSQQLSCHCRGCCFPLLPRRHEHMLACLPEVFFTHTYIYMHTFGLPQLALVVDVLNVIIHIAPYVCMYSYMPSTIWALDGRLYDEQPHKSATTFMLQLLPNGIECNILLLPMWRHFVCIEK